MLQKPPELELIERKILQLETELVDLKAEQHALTAKWQSDQDTIDDIETIKKEIDTTNINIQQAERNYDLSLAAELKYGKLAQLQTKLQTAEITLAQSQTKAKPHSPSIAETVTESVEISILEPAITEKSATDEHASDIYDRLLRDRIIFLASAIDEDAANLIVSQLLLLEAEDPAKDVYLYINSLGGSISAGMSIFDVMNQIRPDVCTVCFGVAAGMGAFLLSAGAKAKRMSLSTGRIIMTKPVGGTKGQGRDIAIQAQEIVYLTAKLNNLLAQHTGQSVAKIDRDTDRDFYLNAAEAKEYGLIDTVIDRGVN